MAAAAAPKPAAPTKLAVSVKPDDLKDRSDLVSKLLLQWENNEGSESEWQKVVSENKAALADAVLMHFESATMDVSISGDIVHLMHVMVHLCPSAVIALLLKSNLTTKPLIDEAVKWSWQKLGTTINYGPMSKQELKKEWDTKKLGADNKVWHDGMKSWEPVKSVPCLNRFLTSAVANKRRVSTAPQLDCKVMNDEQLLVWRLQILAAAIGPLAANAGQDLKTAVEVKERQGLMNELLTLLPEYRPEVQALIAQNLFALEAIDPEAGLLLTEAAGHTNGSVFAKIVVVLFSAKDTTTLAPAGEFVDATVKKAADSSFFDTTDIDNLQSSLWRVIANTKDDQVFLQSVVTIQTIVKTAPASFPDAKFLTHLAELKNRAVGLAQSKQNDELVVTLATEIKTDVEGLLKEAAWASKQRPPSPKAIRGKPTGAVAAAAAAADAKAGAKKTVYKPDSKKKDTKTADKKDQKSAPAAAAPKKLALPFTADDYKLLSTGDAKSISASKDAFITKLAAFSKAINGDATEEDWRVAVEATDFQLPKILGLILIHVRLTSDDVVALVNNISILASINPEEVCTRLAAIKGFLHAYSQHIKPVGRLPPEREAAAMGNWQLDSEKDPEVLAREKKLAAEKEERARLRDAAEQGATIFEARLLFFLNCALSAPDPAGPESKVPGIEDMTNRMMELVVFEDSALAVEMAGGALICLNIIDPDKTVLNSAADAKRESRQALMESSYKFINRAEHDAKAALSEDQRRKLEWSSLIWIQNVVDQHSEYFYKSDVQVLVDSLLRRSLDGGIDAMLPEYLRTLGALCAWADYPPDRNDEKKLHKETEIATFYVDLSASAGSVVPPTELTEAVQEQIGQLANAWDELVAARAKG